MMTNARDIKIGQIIRWTDSFKYEVIDKRETSGGCFYQFTLRHIPTGKEIVGTLISGSRSLKVLN